MFSAIFLTSWNGDIHGYLNPVLSNTTDMACLQSWRFFYVTPNIVLLSMIEFVVKIDGCFEVETVEFRTNEGHHT